MPKKIIFQTMRKIHIYVYQCFIVFYFPNSKTAQSHARSALENCISQISTWMSINRLKLNSVKTEFVILGTRQQLAKMEYDSISIAGEVIKTKSCVRNLGVYMYAELRMNEHVQHVVRICFGKIREIASFRKYLTQDVTQTLVQAVIISHIDYANSLLYGISQHLIDKLQRVQNAAARLILGYKKHESISPGLFKLHWLPVKYRIQCKIVTITFKILSTNEPSYLRSLLTVQESTRTRRTNHLIIPRSRLKTAGDRSFSVSAPKIWNSLPDTVRNAQSLLVFKKNLKTFYFRRANSHFLSK